MSTKVKVMWFIQRHSAAGTCDEDSREGGGSQSEKGC